MRKTNSVPRLIPLTLFFILLSATKSFSQNPFVTVWKTDNTGGATGTNQIRVPATGSYTYTWARIGTPASSGSGSGTGQLDITFPAAGTYRLNMTPTGTTPFSRIAFSTATSDAPKLMDVEKWGDVAWSSMQSAFANATNLASITATDLPNLTNVTSMRDMFYQCYTLVSVNGINSWTTTSVTNMSRMFSQAFAFNSNIGSWDVSNVLTMNQMFTGASVFNQAIGGWDVRKVQDMGQMFQTASAFNQDIGAWQVRDATNMASMFQAASNFNQDISSWDVNGVLRMDLMFNGARKFNQPIGSWNVSTVTTMASMFFNADVFNNPLSAWDVSSVTTMASMFGSADVFNQNLGTWKLNSVTNVTSMFNLTALSCSNYSNTLIGWAAAPGTPNNLTLSNNTLFAGGSITYGTACQPSRNTLITTKGWTISGDAYDPACVVNSATLPVKFSYFAATKQGGHILLQWTTSSEQDNTGFEIQKSADGSSWEKLGFIPTKAWYGNSSEALTYQFTDNTPRAGINQYRLRQVDIDGQFEYSEIRTVDFNNTKNNIRFYPNPVKSILLVEGLQQESHVQVLNNIGQVLVNKKIAAGNTILPVDLSAMSPGIYFIQVSDANGKLTTQKIVKE